MYVQEMKIYASIGIYKIRKLRMKMKFKTMNKRTTSQGMCFLSVKLPKTKTRTTLI